MSICPKLQDLSDPGDRRWAESGPELEDRSGGHPKLDDAFLRSVEEQVFPADTMAIVYSSGSTADPKGAVHSHGAAIRRSHNLLEGRGLSADDRSWSPMPFFWVGGFEKTPSTAMATTTPEMADRSAKRGCCISRAALAT